MDDKLFAENSGARTTMQQDLVKAIELALAGKWDDAHNLVQRFEGNSTAAWIHAVLHKIEGDPENSRYWYRRAGKMEHFPDEAQSELARIQQEVKDS